MWSQGQMIDFPSLPFISYHTYDLTLQWSIASTACAYECTSSWAALWTSTKRNAPHAIISGEDALALALEELAGN